MKLEEDPDIVAGRGLEAGRVGSERCCWTPIGRGLEESLDGDWKGWIWMEIGRNVDWKDQDIITGGGLEGTSIECSSWKQTNLLEVDRTLLEEDLTDVVVADIVVDYFNRRCWKWMKLLEDNSDEVAGR